MRMKLMRSESELTNRYRAVNGNVKALKLDLIAVLRRAAHCPAATGRQDVNTVYDG